MCQNPNCDKVFGDNSALRKHMMTHGERQYLCPVGSCGKRFLDNSKLKRHMLVHSGDKPYRCQICDKQFSLDFNLRTHLRTHTGEKPYVCTVPGCCKRFTQSSNLTAHEKTHFNRDRAAHSNPGQTLRGAVSLGSSGPGSQELADPVRAVFLVIHEKDLEIPIAQPSLPSSQLPEQQNELPLALEPQRSVSPTLSHASSGCVLQS